MVGDSDGWKIYLDQRTKPLFVVSCKMYAYSPSNSTLTHYTMYVYTHSHRLLCVTWGYSKQGYSRSNGLE